MRKKLTIFLAACFLTLSSFAVGPILGTPHVCVGATTVLTDTTTGGLWFSSNTAIATIGSTGTVTGVSAGVVTISYYHAGIVTMSFTVNPIPVISGGSSICVGSSTTLTATPSGGTWTSGNTAIATVTSGGVVTGVSGGVVNIYYSSGGCNAYHTVTVNPAAAITGSSTVCVGNTITLAATPSGGTWSSSNTAVATVTSGGVVTGVSSGVVNIYYLSGGCYTYHTVTVNPAAAITGGSSVCVGSSITLTATPSGGTWTSSNTAVATVSSGGVVTGVSGGVVNIYYNSGGCYAYHVVTVNPAAVITGSSSVCVGSSITLTATPVAGTWTSGNTAIATVTSGGVVTGVSGGVVNIYYYSGGCYAYHTVTVNPAAAITGPSVVCIGASITLTATPSGGAWLSSNTAIATVTSGGVVTGVSGGVVNIYYSSGGCYAYHTVTVNPAAAISGPSVVCVGASITLTASPSGGVWTSGNTAIATVTSGGVVTGVSGGVVNIYYYSGGCYAYHTVTVNAAAAITGPSEVCVGSTIILAATPSGGTWTSGNTAVATVTSGGVVTGVHSGVVNIYYYSGGCYAYHTVTVDAAAAITGPSTVCTGSSITLTGSPSGGTWTSSNTAVATVGSGGVVTGVSGGVVNIYYHVGACYAYHIVTVNPAATISGANDVCVGSTITLTASPSGGTWSSSNTTVATVSSGGVVTGVHSGVVNIYYLHGGCYSYHTVTVDATAAITGLSEVCVGSSITLSATPSGGTWISSNITVATVSSGGVVTGLHSGVVNIYYHSGGCYAYHTVTVNAAAAISGPSVVCVGSSITLTGTPSGGTWTSSNTAVATVSTGGVVTGVSGGVVNIYYHAGGCYAYHIVTVNPVATISGPSDVCVGSTITLTASPSGGTWSSSNTTVATVSSGGVVTGIHSGVVNIYYLHGGCYTYHTVTVNATAAISGPSSVCVGSAITLTGTPSGGTWTSSNTTVATVSSGGVVTGVHSGVVNIYYHSGGCYAYHIVTVNATAAITGLSSVCVGSAITLAATPTGGTWISSNTGIATVSSAGVVTGVSAGVVNIYYSMGGCGAYHRVTVNPIPTISGSLTVCVGSSTTLTGTPSGGTWATGYTACATITSGGVLTGITPGTVVVYYSVGGCYTYRMETVNPTPSPITGPGSVYVDNDITLADATPGGTWHSSDTSIAIVNPTTGVVSGVSAGTVTIYYTVGGCSVYKVITVLPELLMPIHKDGNTVNGNISNISIGNSGKKPVTGVVSDGSIKLYPNPASDNLNITWQDQQPGSADVVITDIAGRVVYKSVIDITETPGQVQIDLSAIHAGIYIVSVKSDAIHYNGRLTIQK